MVSGRILHLAVSLVGENSFFFFLIIIVLSRTTGENLKEKSVKTAMLTGQRFLLKSILLFVRRPSVNNNYRSDPKTLTNNSLLLSPLQVFVLLASEEKVLF